MKKMELLSPAGEMEKLDAALKGGADAFYLSGKNFGARKFAGNFTEEEMIVVVEKAHLYDKKIYVTVNTIIFNDEYNEVFAYLKFLNNINVDGVIIQDLGLLKLCSENFKDLEIHASTQMSIHSLSGAKFAKNAGVKRVVLARENSLEEIKAVVDEGIDTEVFIHGAHCISYSGQCLMSSIIGGRSGNRGACAQPCRQTYELYNSDGELVKEIEGEYLLSPKDMKTLDELEQFKSLGAMSLKIEGRMKNKYYAYATAHEYYSKLNNLPVEISSETIFNREYTKGRIFGEKDSKFMNYHSPENHGKIVGEVIDFNDNIVTLLSDVALNQGDEIKIFRQNQSVGGRVERVLGQNRYKMTTKSIFKKGEIAHLTYDTDLFKKIDEILNKNLQLIPLKINFFASEKGMVKATFISQDIEIELLRENLAEPAKRVALSSDDIKEQMSKLGDTVYFLESFECKIDGNIFIRKSDLNELRREAITQMNINRNKRYENQIIGKNEMPLFSDYNMRDERITSYEVNTIEQLNTVKEMIKGDIYYSDFYTILDAYEISENIIPILPDISKDSEFVSIHEILKTMDKVDKIMVKTIGQLNYFKDFYSIETDFSFNVTNQYSIDFLNSMDVKKITISEELNESQMNQLKGPIELVVYGYQRMMITDYCIYRANNICGNCTLTGSHLKDRLGNDYPLMRAYGCRMKIMNNRPLNIIQYVDDLKIKNVRLRFTIETASETQAVIDDFKGSRSNRFGTKGHFNKGVL
ncbi:MAG: U32 family peptidase [Clostridiales bacterium]|nr:U32 family peptidase [Clostridiales bacterium]